MGCVYCAHLYFIIYTYIITYNGNQPNLFQRFHHSDTKILYHNTVLVPSELMYVHTHTHQKKTQNIYWFNIVYIPFISETKSVCNYNYFIMFKDKITRIF